MEAGVPGHHGTSALSPVEEECRDAADSVTTPHPSSEAKTALVMSLKTKFATSRTAQLVSCEARNKISLGAF